MMTAEQAARFERYVTHIFYDAVAQVRRFAPRDTGNLADKALKCEWRTDRREKYQRKFVIWVDTRGSTKHPAPGRAPYMPFVNEPWISAYWRGRQNPNEGWWNRAAEFIYLYIMKHLGGFKG